MSENFLEEGPEENIARGSFLVFLTLPWTLALVGGGIYFFYSIGASFTAV